MADLMIPIIGILIILGLLKNSFPKAFSLLKKTLLSAIKGWAHFLWSERRSPGKGAKESQPRARYRE